MVQAHVLPMKQMYVQNYYFGMCCYTLILIRLYSLFTENLKIVMGIWTGIRFLQKCDRGNLFDRKQFIEGLLNEEIQ